MGTARTEPSRALVIGGSAGAWPVLKLLLSELASELDVPVAVVLHRHASSTAKTAEVLGQRTGLDVVEVDDKTPFVPGRVHLGPPGYHLMVESRGELSLSVDPPVHYCRPAVDVLFESAAYVFGAGLVAVVLSGANGDGAEGVRQILARGGAVVVQDPVSAECTAMPEASVTVAGLDSAVHIGDIPDAVRNALAAPVRAGGFSP